MLLPPPSTTMHIAPPCPSPQSPRSSQEICEERSRLQRRHSPVSRVGVAIPTRESSLPIRTRASPARTPVFLERNERNIREDGKAAAEQYKSPQLKGCAEHQSERRAPASEAAIQPTGPALAQELILLPPHDCV